MSKDSEIERLEEIAPLYFTQTLKGVDEKYNRFVIKQFLNMIKGPSILELGCGEGLYTEAIMQVFGKITVVDVSEFLLKNLQNKFGNKIVCHKSLFENFHTSERFDSIVMAHILEHIEDPVAVLKRSKNWLKDDGRIIINVPNADSLHRRIGILMGLLKKPTDLSETDKLVGHRRVYTTKKLVNDITKAELSIQEIGGMTLKPLSNSRMEEWPDSLVQAFCEIGRDMPAEWCGVLYAIAVLRK